MEPPWKAHQDIPAGSIGWRMGRGEDCLLSFWAWFNQLTEVEQAAFREQHPEPLGWQGLYASWHGA